MSQLKTIRQSLAENPEIKIVNTDIVNYLSRGGDYVGFGVYTGYRIVFWAVPKIGLYTANELQASMMNLLPNLKPSHIKKFEQTKHYLNFGRLYFSKIIGEKKVSDRTVITLEEELDTELLPSTMAKNVTIGNSKTQVIIDDVQVTCPEFCETIEVRLYPCEDYAMDILKIPHRVPCTQLGRIGGEDGTLMDELEMYKPKELQKQLKR